jgi:hypothetical protein
MGCERLSSISFSDKLLGVGENIFASSIHDSDGSAPIRTFNLLGRTPGGNGIAGVCELLEGQGQDGNIETFNFSLGDEVAELDGAALVEYLNEVLALNRDDIPLLAQIDSGTLDLGDAAIDVTTELTAHGTLFDTIKQGETTYTWTGAIWKRKEEE